VGVHGKVGNHLLVAANTSDGSLTPRW
jgi:hypothetical protein